MSADPSVFREALDTMIESVAVYDAGARTIYANPATERMFGMLLPDMTGRCLWELFPDSVGNPFHAAFERVAAGGDEERFDHYHPPFDRWFANRITRQGDRVYVVSRDVTDDRRLRRRLEAQARISQVLTADEVVLPAAVRAVAGILTDVLDADCSLALLSPDRAWLERVASTSRTIESLQVMGEMIRWPADSGHPGLALRTRQGVLVDGTHLDGTREYVDDPHVRDVFERYRPTSLLVAPLLVGDDVMGVLIVTRRHGSAPLTAHDLTLVTEIAAGVGLYLANARRRTETSRLQSRMAAITDSNPALISFVDRELRYQYVNSSYARLFSRSREEIVGRSIEEVVGPEAWSTVAPYANLALAGRPVQYRMQLALPGGERHLRAYYEPIFDADGVVEGFAVLVMDITAETRLVEAERQRHDEERRSTRRLQSLLGLTGKLAARDSADAIARVVVDEGVDALDAKMASLWLLSPDGSELRLVRERGFLPSHTAAFARVPLSAPGPLSDCVRSGAPVWIDSRAAYRLQYPEHESTWRPEDEPPLAFAVVPLKIGDRTIGCVNFTFHDERRLSADERTYIEVLVSHTADALRRARLYDEAGLARREAETANQAKDQFLAMLGHELRNPLAPISTALELMRLRGGATLSRERAIIERQVAHLTRLVDDLLDISRITRGMIELRREPVRLAAVVTAAVELTSPLLEQRQQRLTLEVPTELTVFGDPTRLRQVVANLLSNAARYSPPGGPIAVRARTVAQGVVLVVRDEGVGISPEMLGSVFQMFVQAPQDNARTHGGLGLGLAIVKSLVELHEGTVTAHSEGPGRGTELVVTLPIAPPLAREPTPLPDGVRPRAAVARRILIVDDNEDAAVLLGEVLGGIGHVVRLAGDGPSALRIAETFRPEVGVLDIGLPVMDGYELARRLRTADGTAGLRLIAVTGYGQDTDRLRSREAGFDVHLTKPVALDEFVRLVSLSSGTDPFPS